MTLWTIHWDTSDPKNTGWALRVVGPDTNESYALEARRDATLAELLNTSQEQGLPLPEYGEWTYHPEDGGRWEAVQYW